MELSATMKVVLGGVSILWFPAILVAQGLWNRRKANAAQERAQTFFNPPARLPLAPTEPWPRQVRSDPVRVARSRRRKARKAQKAAVRNERRFGASSAEFSR